jgi:signal peptidase I
LKNKSNIFKEFLGYFIVAVVAVVFSILLRLFVIEPYIVPTPSMAPTLVVGDRVIVSKLEYNFNEVERGDIVAIYSPLEKKSLVKRIIALPGEKITFTDEGEVYINGELLEEEYIVEDLYPSYGNNEYIIEDDQYFVMGDNRNNSADSRVFGAIGIDKIFGRVIFIYRPLSRIGRLE